MSNRQASTNENNVNTVEFELDPISNKNEIKLKKLRAIMKFDRDPKCASIIFLLKPVFFVCLEFAKVEVWFSIVKFVVNKVASTDDEHFLLDHKFKSLDFIRDIYSHRG